MILTKEDYGILTQIQVLLAKVLKNAVMSEIEEAHERNFEKQLNSELKNERAFEIILLKRRKQLPMKYREIFTEKWFKDHTRQKPNGIYEIRCSIDKKKITGSGNCLETAAENFIKSLMKADSESKKPKKPEKKRVLFNDFAVKWCEVVKKPTVKPITNASIVINLNAHIKPFFKKKYIDEITAMQIQPLFNKFIEEGKSHAAQNVKIILNQIFEGAVTEQLIVFNPMKGVKILKHHNKNGVALTYAEEREFLQKLESSKYRLTFAIMLFGGMRRSELASVRIEGDFLVIKDGKRRLSQVETERKVPVTPMLKRFLEGATSDDIKNAVSPTCDKLSRAFKELCPAHHLHELRHTFVTRCQECGVPREVVSVWAGHAADNTMTSNVYTHFSPEFMLSEGAKVDYYNRVKG